MLFETPRLIARFLNEKDFSDIWRLQSNPEAMRYIRTPETDPEAVRERLQKWAQYAQASPGLGVFAIEIKEKNAFAGYCTARHVDYNPDTGEFEIGYALLPEFWGQGLVSELVPHLAAYLFKVSGTPKIVAFTDPENIASQKVLLKNGFRTIGRRFVYDSENVEFELRRHKKVDDE